MSAEGNPAAPAAPVGGTIPLLNGRYELGDRLADGTFFSTYRGRDLQSGRHVAVKVLKSAYAADEVFATRLLSEARSAVSLQHPNVAQVYDAFVERGTVVLITEWVRGISLEERIRRVAPFPLAVAMDIFQACAEALNHAHENGFIHGDVRPENVIITPDGRVKVTDFGVGSSIAASSRIQLGALPRVADYLAPEVAQGRAADARTDIYSLGCVLYEMLTGAVPFEADTPLAVAVRHLNDPAPSPRQKNSAVPNAVDGIARKCMLKEPMARYLTVTALLQDVRSVQEAMRGDRPLTWSPLKEPETPTPVPAANSKPKTPPRPAPAPEVDTGPSVRLLVALPLVALLIVAASFFAVQQVFFRTPSEVSVPPGLVGMRVEAATTALEAVGLKAEVRQDYQPDVESGAVYATVPVEGTEVKAGKAVILYVSRGGQPVTVPDVAGKTLAEAQKEIRAAGLMVGETKEDYSEIIEKGQVISQSPVGGSEAKKKSPVDLHVSKGPQPLPEPDPVGVRPLEPTPDPGATPPDAPPEDTPSHEYSVEVRIPRSASGPQRVEIIVRNQDGSEETVYDQEHQAGEKIEPTVTVRAQKGRGQIRVYLNGKVIQSTDV